MLRTILFTGERSARRSTLSLHDALPISGWLFLRQGALPTTGGADPRALLPRSEEHTSELQSPYDLVCRLLLEKKKTGGDAWWSDAGLHYTTAHSRLLDALGSL